MKKSQAQVGHLNQPAKCCKAHVKKKRIGEKGGEEKHPLCFSLSLSFSILSVSFAMDELFLSQQEKGRKQKAN